MRKILLNKNISKESVNEVNIVPIELNRDISLLQDEILTDTIDTMEVYNKEKDECTNHRFIFTLYPLCTNVLCNKITEIVYQEGSKDCYVLNSGTEPTRINAIKNTEYSNDKYNYTYHCGVDIFNNHLLRKKEDIYIEDYAGDKLDNFNTINDVYRTGNDKKYEIQIIVPNELEKQWYNLNNVSKKSLPVYQYDTIKSFYEAYNTNLKKENGFVGFNNPSTIPIFIKKDGYYINKCINNLANCQFVDLCPERELFYFTPKVNQSRKRVEYNWDYYLSYPFENVYDGIFLDSNVNGLPLINFDDINILYKKQYGSNGLITLLFRCACKHNLNIRDNIKLKFIGDSYKNNKKESFYKEINCNVVNIGENGKNKDYYFSVLANDVESVINIEDNIFEKDDIISEEGVDIKITQIRFSKIVSGYECKYYFRKFKEIEILNGDERIKLKNSLNKLAFANTIYGEDVSQLIYTDSVDIMNLKDNLGRPLTEVYLTFIKNNKGYDEWYNLGDYGSEKVEYSHVFGKVTSGLDLPSYVKEFKLSFPTVRGQHNIQLNKFDDDGNYEINLDDGSNIVLNLSSGHIEDNITRNKGENILYGDLVEFNPITLNEIVIEKIKHRFNTYQRELTNNQLYDTIYHDEITRDFYDITGKEGDYTIATEERKLNEKFANLGPEGYIYEPHHRIKIGEYDDIVKQASDILMKISDEFTLYVDNNNNNEYLVFSTNINYGILPGDLVSYCEKDGKNLKKFRVLNYYSSQNQNVNVFYFICGNIKNEKEQFTLYELESDDDKELFEQANESQKIYIDGEISKDKDGDYIVNNNKLKDSGILINNNFLKYIIDNKKVYQIKSDVNMSTKLFDTSIYSFFQHNLEIPEYAYMLPDGTGRHLWREIKKPSSYNFTSDLYNIPFTNNAFYHHTNVIFTVKRQDPNREYGMFLRQGSNGPIIDNNFEVKSDKFDISSEEYIDNTIGQTCF